LLSEAVNVEVKPRSGSVIRGVLELAVVVVFAFLIWNNYTLRRQQTRAAAAVKSARAFTVHDSIAALPIVELNGARGTLPLDRRTIVAIVDPRCDSCRALLARIRSDSGVQIVSVAPIAETRAMAQESGLNSVTHALATPETARIDPRLQIYPQLFVVEQGHVVRTCASIDECTATPHFAVER
jgi:hypothetical protein